MVLSVVLVVCGDFMFVFCEILVFDVLCEYSKLFEKEVVEVIDGVYVVVGFGFVNFIMLEGDDGIIIVDIMEMVVEGEVVLVVFWEIIDKLIVVIIYIYNYVDYVFGVWVFVVFGEVLVYVY